MSVEYWLNRIKELVEKEKRIHYTRIALKLRISPNYARMLAKMLAEEIPERYQYIRGILLLVEN